MSTKSIHRTARCLPPSSRQLAAYCGLTVEEVEKPPRLSAVVFRRHQRQRMTEGQLVRPDQLRIAVLSGKPLRYPFITAVTDRGYEKGFWVQIGDLVDLRSEDGHILWSCRYEQIEEEARA